MTELEITGKCFCGRIVYRSIHGPIHSVVCYCEDCRRISGAQSVAWVTFPYSVFSFIQGEPKRFHSSKDVVRTFCDQCGTSLSYQHKERGDEIDIQAATLDDPEAFPPTKALCIEHKLQWDSIPKGLGI